MHNSTRRPLKLAAGLLAILIAGVLVLAVILLWPSHSIATRDLGCANIQARRGAQICRALSEATEWTWFGHAILAPGWRVTWSALRQVYCSQQLTDADRGDLEILTRVPDWRLQSAAENLLRLLEGEHDVSVEPETSIFNPKNPSYVLKRQCFT